MSNCQWYWDSSNSGEGWYYVYFSKQGSSIRPFAPQQHLTQLIMVSCFACYLKRRSHLCQLWLSYQIPFPCHSQCIDSHTVSLLDNKSYCLAMSSLEMIVNSLPNNTVTLYQIGYLNTAWITFSKFKTLLHNELTRLLI